MESGCSMSIADRAASYATDGMPTEEAIRRAIEAER
jgi:hypothetical protein